MLPLKSFLFLSAGRSKSCGKFSWEVMKKSEQFLVCVNYLPNSRVISST